MKLQKIVSLNPGKNYELIGEVVITSHAEVDQKVVQAKKAFPSWSALSFKKRAEYLEKFYHESIKRKNEIGALSTKEMGMTIASRNQIDIDSGLQYLRGYLDFAHQWISPEIVYEDSNEMHTLFFEPRGVAGVSVPWNYPYCNFIWGVMQNLIVGNTVVFKHSEECILTSKLLEEIMHSVGLPEGVFNAVYGDGSDVGEYLMNNKIDLIYFTGSTGVGKHLYQVAAKNFIPAILELGGSAPGIIFDDADLAKHDDDFAKTDAKLAKHGDDFAKMDAELAKTIESIYSYRFINNGQSCDALKRLIVQRTIFDKVVHALAKLVATKKVGDPEDPKSDLGPLVAKRQLDALESQVEDAVKKGANLITGGKRPAGLQGAYYEPTLLTGITFDMRVWQEEVFGPVLPIVPFDAEEEAIALANDTRYGLGGYIYTNDKERALRVSSQIKTGNISINGVGYGLAHDPFGGYKDSGLGREHGKQGLREFCVSKLVVMKK